MPKPHFPDLRKEKPKTPQACALYEEGIVAVGGDLSVETLKAAYKKGIFPWPLPEYPKKFRNMTWFCPDPRGILDFKELHVPRSLRKSLSKSTYTYTINQEFKTVITACRKTARPGQHGTWITADLLEAYVNFHKAGFAHSVEVWEGDELVAGLYGVDANGVFAGESMFTTVDNGSKLALLHLIDHLQSRGADWMDIQMVTPHMERLGAKLIRRDAFLNRLARSQSQGLRLFEK